MKPPPQIKDWSYLPKDIVKSIMEKLCWSERVRLSMIICKNWQTPIHELEIRTGTGINMFPWLMGFNWDYFKGQKSVVCKLIDPCAEKSYHVDMGNTIVKELELRRTKRSYSDAVDIFASRYGWVREYDVDICASRNGWLLFKQSERFGWCSKVFFYLYSPFTNEVIELPMLEIKDNAPNRATFSLSSSFPNCHVFVIMDDNRRRQKIKICRPGDETWMEFPGTEFGEYIKIIDIAYANDCFYVAYEDGKLFAFDIKLGEWKPLLDQGMVVIRLISSSNGDILMKDVDYKRYWRFDLSEKQWVEVDRETLRHHVIFIGQRSFSSFSVPAVGEASKYAGRVCYTNYPYDGLPQCYTYNISTKVHAETEIWIEPGNWRACDLLQSYFVDGLKYASSHEWVRREGLIATIGITHRAQDYLGEVVYVELPEPGNSVVQGRSFGALEMKGTRHDVCSPISGEIVEVNSKLIDTPGLINSSPYEEGWMIKVKISNPSELESLKGWKEYDKFCKDRIKTETCCFSGQKIYPGKGIRFVSSDAHVFLFANSKCKRHFHNRLQPSKLSWTAKCRKQHNKKCIAQLDKVRNGQEVLGETEERIKKTKNEKKSRG